MDKNKAFRQWQGRMGFTRRHVSNALGIAINTVAGYRAGKRTSGEVEVPKNILLACAAIEEGLPPIKEENDK
jgi:predicted transcriptional regulator